MRKAGLPHVFSLLVGLLTACATSSRPPSSAPTPLPGEDGVAQEADETTTDADGDAEATDEPIAGDDGPCPLNMALVADGTVRICVDKYEASLLEADADGSERPYPHWLPVDGHVVRAVSVPAVFPQGYISEVQAEDACVASGKRLCAYNEWKAACMGPSKTTFPYGDARRPGACHDTGKSAVGAVFGARALTDPVATKAPSLPAAGVAATPAARGTTRAGAKGTTPAKPVSRQAQATKGRAAQTTHARAIRPRPGTATQTAQNAKTKKKGTTTRAGRPPETLRATAKASSRPASVEASVWSQLNDPRLGQVDGALARTGSHDECVNGYGVVDMVGNVHEWVRGNPASPHGMFVGGYYLDTTLNGDGCQYRTGAHAHDYHDYSTGFRCCAEPRAATSSP